MTPSFLSRFYWRLSLLLSLLLTPSFVPAQATQAVTVRVAPPTVEIPLGQTIDVAVEVNAVQDLYGFDLALKFDPSVVEVVDADPAEAGVQTALGVFLDSGFVVLNAADNLTGTLRFVMTQLNPSEPKSGTGALIVIRLRGKQVGDGKPLTLTGAQLARRDGTSLPTNLVSGVINVISSVGSAPISTPIPTQGAGTPLPNATPLSVPPTALAVGAPSQPTPMMTSPSATPVPQPTDRSVAVATDMLIESVTPPAPTHQATNTQSTTATLQATAAQPVSTAPVVTNTPVAVAAVSEPAATPSASQSAIQVTEPAALAASSSESASGLLAVSGVLGLAGLITVWMVTRRRSA